MLNNDERYKEAVFAKQEKCKLTTLYLYNELNKTLLQIFQIGQLIFVK